MLRDGTAYVQAGGGIVADSDPPTEDQESQNKAAAVVRAIAVAQTLSRRPDAGPDEAVRREPRSALTARRAAAGGLVAERRQPWWRAIGGGLGQLQRQRGQRRAHLGAARPSSSPELARLVLRARGRRVVGGRLIALAGAGMVVAGALRSASERRRGADAGRPGQPGRHSSRWPPRPGRGCTRSPAAGRAAGAVSMVVRAGRWPVRTARFERGAVGAGPDLADDPAARGGPGRRRGPDDPARRLDPAADPRQSTDRGPSRRPADGPRCAIRAPQGTQWRFTEEQTPVASRPEAPGRCSVSAGRRTP